jgi:ankyrin repeat protein
MSAHAGQWGAITLFDAAADGKLDLIKQRLGASWTQVDAKDSAGNTALVEAARWAHDDCVEYLLEKGANIHSKNPKGQTALHIAAQQGRDSTCKLLVSKGANVNEKDEDGETPLMYAAARDQITTITTLLALGADKTVKNLKGKDVLAMSSNQGTIAIKAGKKTFDSFTKY